MKFTPAEKGEKQARISFYVTPQEKAAWVRYAHREHGGLLNFVRYALNKEMDKTGNK